MGDVVLNARRHRSGNYRRTYPDLALPGAMCSTPEGIGAGITRRCCHAGGPDGVRCSTPEGIGAGITSRSARTCATSRSAQRPKASERELHGYEWRLGAYWKCSTPEGIGAGITAAGVAMRPGPTA